MNTLDDPSHIQIHRDCVVTPTPFGVILKTEGYSTIIPNRMTQQLSSMLPSQQCLLLQDNAKKVYSNVVVGSCQHIMKGGPRRGERCGGRCDPNKDEMYCTKHSLKKAEQAMKVKEQDKKHLEQVARSTGFAVVKYTGKEPRRPMKKTETGERVPYSEEELVAELQRLNITLDQCKASLANRKFPEVDPQKILKQRVKVEKKMNSLRNYGISVGEYYGRQLSNEKK
jgi:hypothetical protein